MFCRPIILIIFTTANILRNGLLRGAGRRQVVAGHNGPALLRKTYLRNVDKFSILCIPDCRIVKLASKKRARAATLKYKVAVTVPLDEGDFCTVIGKMQQAGTIDSPLPRIVDAERMAMQRRRDLVAVEGLIGDVYKRQRDECVERAGGGAWG